MQIWPCISPLFKCLLAKGFPFLRDDNRKYPVGYGVYIFRRLTKLTVLVVLPTSGIQAARGVGLKCQSHFPRTAFPPGSGLFRRLHGEPVCFVVWFVLEIY